VRDNDFIGFKKDKETLPLIVEGKDVFLEVMKKTE